MTQTMVATKTAKILKECDRHQQRLEYALAKMNEFMPISAADYEELNDEQVEAIDQFLFRFGKLQDAIGRRLLSGVLELLGEPVKEVSFIDRLNRLEQLKIIENKDSWLNLRNIRNNLAHEYEDDPEGMSQALNDTYDSYDILKGVYIKIKEYLAHSPHLMAKL